MKALFKLFLLACITLFGTACSNSVKLTGNEFLIEGKISGVDDGVVISFGNSDWGRMRDTVKNGRFMFRGEVLSNIEKMSISARGEGFPEMFLSVWVTPGAKVKIKGKDKLIPLWKVKSSVPYQKEENRFVNKSRDIIAENARLSVEYADFRTKEHTAASADEAIAYRKILDSLNVIRESLTIRRIYSNIEIMEKTDVFPVWLEEMKALSGILRFWGSRLKAEQSEYLRKKVEELYSKMSEDNKNTILEYEIEVANFLSPPLVVEVGDNMADADLLDVDGNTKRIADYLGKYLLLDFWASWCTPCRAAFPEMKEISETYSDKLTIISINIDSDTVWKKAMVEHDMPWVNFRDSKGIIGGLAANYGVTGIPNYVLISPEGIIVDKWAGYGTGFLKQKVSENMGM